MFQCLSFLSSITLPFNSFSLTVLLLISVYFSLLCFSSSLSLSLAFPLIGLSLRSHLAITSSCRLFRASRTLLYLLFSPSVPLFLRFVTAMHIYRTCTVNLCPRIPVYISQSLLVPYVFSEAPEGEERRGDGDEGGRCIPSSECFSSFL